MCVNMDSFSILAWKILYDLRIILSCWPSDNIGKNLTLNQNLKACKENEN